MDFEASDKPKFCGGDDEEHLNFKWLASFDKKTSHSASREDYESEDDDDDVPISWRIKMHDMSTDKSFSLLKKELALVENSFEECKRKRQVEEERLQSIKRDVEECSKELENKKKEISYVGRINEVHKIMEGEIEECDKDFVAREGQLYSMEDLIGERKQELNTKEMDRCEVMDNISKQKKFESLMKELVNDLVSRHKHFESRTKELESREKQLDGRMKELKLKEDEFEGRVKELESEKKHSESRKKELETQEKQYEEQMKEFQSKEEEFKGHVKEFKTKKKQFEIDVEDFKSKKKQFEERWEELEFGLCRVSSSQEQLLKCTHFVGDTLTSPCNNHCHDDVLSQFDTANIIPLASSANIFVTPPAIQRVPQDVFHTPLEESSLPSFDIDVTHCVFNQAIVDVDDESQVFFDMAGFEDGDDFMDFAKDSDRNYK